MLMDRPEQGGIGIAAHRRSIIMPNDTFVQRYHQGQLRRAAQRAQAVVDWSADTEPPSDHGIFAQVFNERFGADALAIFDRVRVYRNPQTYQLQARGRIDDESFKVWRDDMWMIQNDIHGLMSIPVHSSPAEALQALVQWLGDHLFRCGKPLDLLDAAIHAAAHDDAAQPDITTATIAMLQGDLAATRLVTQTTFGPAVSANGLWRVAYEHDSSAAGTAILTVCGSTGETYRLSLASTPTGWRWLVKRLYEGSNITYFTPSDDPHTMYRRLLHAIGTVRRRKT